MMKAVLVLLLASTCVNWSAAQAEDYWSKDQIDPTHRQTQPQVQPQVQDDTTLAHGSVWEATEDDSTWVNYPSAVRDRLDEQYDRLSANLPSIKIYQLYPEPVNTTLRVWPELKGVLKRMEGVWPQLQVAYYLETGMDYGCRQLEQGIEKPVLTHHCQRHCTHAGRYCADNTDQYHGSYVVQEVTRRLCLAEHLKKSKRTGGNKFVRYLEEFEANQCGDVASGELVAQCSKNIMTTVLRIPVEEDEELLDCMEPDWTLDQFHDPLERNLYHFEQLWHKQEQSTETMMLMPRVEINDVSIKSNHVVEREWTTKDFLTSYCNAFPACLNTHEIGTPLACPICGNCQDVQTCMWTLQCDGTPALDDQKVMDINTGDFDKQLCDPNHVVIPTAPTDAALTEQTTPAANNTDSSMTTTTPTATENTPVVESSTSAPSEVTATTTVLTVDLTAVPTESNPVVDSTSAPKDGEEPPAITEPNSSTSSTSAPAEETAPMEESNQVVESTSAPKDEPPAMIVAEPNNSSASSDTSTEKRNLKAGIILVVVSVVALAVAFVYRRQQKNSSRNERLREWIQNIQTEYSDQPDDDGDVEEVWGKSARTSRRNDSNIAPRPHEDPLQEELEQVTFENFLGEDETPAVGPPPAAFSGRIDIDDDGHMWI
ncbi:expressed unknown protein [Seminavis robusta]|uniref:Vacuolar sorting receptor thioredoxin-like domain-containing protein n=1 Tax=Seminavis robusta TaxID=568900 RepID=A0A9N8DA23_9STRA|nr:expressed unknown protein [Seminavis robusta]|eukprot:Sro55_g032170.1 n/a (655) ;mRNA; f:20734-22698